MLCKEKIPATLVDKFIWPTAVTLHTVHAQYSLGREAANMQLRLRGL